MTEPNELIYAVRKWYKIKEHVTTNLEAYYQEKARQLVPSFQQIWETFVYESVQHPNSREILDYLHGANERLKQLIFAKDRISDIIKAQPFGNDTWFLLNFYIFHIISLIKSIGDNLAWLVKLYCNIKINDKKTDLAIRGFENSLKSTNIRLYQCIFGDHEFEEFRSLKRFRDIIHHKHALHVEQVKLGFYGPESVMVPVDPESGLIIDGKRFMELKYPKLAEAKDKDSIAKYGLKALHVWTGDKEDTPWQDPVVFCEKFVNLMSRAYNCAYERMLMEIRRLTVGKVTRYFKNIGVAIITLTGALGVNDTILIEGKTTSFIQPVLSMEINKKQVHDAKAGQIVGLKVSDKVREGDVIFKLPR